MFGPGIERVFGCRAHAGTRLQCVEKSVKKGFPLLVCISLRFSQPRDISPQPPESKSFSPRSVRIFLFLSFFSFPLFFFASARIMFQFGAEARVSIFFDLPLSFFLLPQLLPNHGKYPESLLQVV